MCPRKTHLIFFETLRSRVDETLLVAIPANGAGRVVLELYICQSYSYCENDHAGDRVFKTVP